MAKVASLTGLIKKAAELEGSIVRSQKRVKTLEQELVKVQAQIEDRQSPGWQEKAKAELARKRAELARLEALITDDSSEDVEEQEDFEEEFDLEEEEV
jgi:hypothetical protein